MANVSNEDNAFHAYMAGLWARAHMVGNDPSKNVRTFRISYFCPHCDEEHIYRGTWLQCSESATILLSLGMVQGLVMADEAAAMNAESQAIEPHVKNISDPVDLSKFFHGPKPTPT